MSAEDQQPQPPRLGDLSKDAVDRFFEHGLGDGHDGVGQGGEEQKLRDLLGLLSTPVCEESHRESRADLIEVLAQRLGQGNGPSLSVTDARACDDFVDAGYESSAMPAGTRERGERLEAIGAALTGGAASGSRERLVSQTLAGIQSHIDAQESSMRIGGRSGGYQLTGRWADLVSIAAMLLLAASVIMPVMSGLRSARHKEMCFSNMGQVANAFGLYTGANRDMLPMATAGFGPTWMDVGTTPDRSNSSNLYTLVRNEYAGLDDLACPTNPNAATGDAHPEAMDWNSLNEISYSYRIMPRGGMRATGVDAPVRVVLLADRSPVILRIKAGQPVRPEENSPNHKQAGQHMLMLDGSARWSDTPVLDAGDNIWLPRPIESLIHQVREKQGIITGSELPDGPTDAFVGP